MCKRHCVTPNNNKKNIVICGLSGSTECLHTISNGMVKKKKVTGHKMCFDFLCNFCVKHFPSKGRYTLSVKLSEFTVTSYLTEKLSKLRSFHRQ